jgi:hypothetical protein
MDCIHAEACRRFADNNTYWNIGDCPIYKPTADVVPKSEVEKLIIDSNAARLGMIAEGHNDPRGEYGAEGEDGKGDLNPLYCMQKAEIAREIFEDIENTLNQRIKLYYTITVSTVESIDLMKATASERALRAFRDYVAELKKKYTEGE